MTTDPLAMQLAIYMDELQHRFTRPTAIFDALIRWGEDEIQLQGSSTAPMVAKTCEDWWTAHIPIEQGSTRDAWFELRVVIDTLLGTRWDPKN